MTPADIRQQFENHWAGTEEQLDTVLEEFYNDIRDSFASAMELETVRKNVSDTVLTTVDDYVGNHYF